MMQGFRLACSWLSHETVISDALSLSSWTSMVTMMLCTCRSISACIRHVMGIIICEIGSYDFEGFSSEDLKYDHGYTLRLAVKGVAFAALRHVLNHRSRVDVKEVDKLFDVYSEFQALKEA
eukprot:TRINITY_DN77001_c0_g1_i1.p2 TRINITY_DN77001_c0_g1~~TRINITY_DN77001_c0_g1_i1.p2  ORF type:complete len:121 (+),score=20.32 TRINITY_DN77001_c0_g1_i1:91-453(+)